MMLHPTSGETASESWMPPERALAMPVQDLAQGPSTHCVREAEPRSVLGVRSAVFAAALLLTAAFAWQLYAVLAVVRLTPVQAVFLVLSTLAFGSVALGSVTSLAGALLIGAGLRPGLQLPGTGPVATRVALLFPVYHEAPETIAGNIEAMARELADLGAAHSMDIFVLSDSRSPESADRERSVFALLTQRLAPVCRIYYRRREENTGRKAGNIADWVSRHGDAYDCFVILDADSIMTGALLVRLARAMEREPRCGLIQTVPRLTGGTTLFQRLQQFAAGMYGPPIAAGIAVWQGTRGNYWGHNAIIRTSAFAATCGLPELPGKPPFGGSIMSHDFVEAALMQRAGWSVVMAHLDAGSYEGSPPTIVEHAMRDRRWAQGNLQHLGVLARAALNPLGRMHLLMGATSYIVSAIWAVSIAVGMLLALQAEHIVPSYFRDEKTLFPIWPVIDPDAARRLFLATLAVVMLPKIIGLALEAARDGGPRLARLGGICLETVMSVLLAPVLMVTQTRALAEIVLGHDAGWAAQRRGGTDIPLWDALVLTRWHFAVGAALCATSLAVSVDLALWMSPVIAGLILAGPLVWATSRIPPLLVERLLSIDEDENRPAILAAAVDRGAAYTSGA